MSLMRWDILNLFIKKRGYKDYLEIGYYKGWSFDRVECEHKTAVDPNPSKFVTQESSLYGAIMDSGNLVDRGGHVIFKKTSDDFFASITPSSKWDIIFIDGLHEASQVYRDAKNALNHLNSGGVIIFHDCNPPLEAHTTTGIDGCWTGDTYKAFIPFRNENGWLSYTVDTDWGVGVVDLSTNSAEHKIDFPQIPSMAWQDFDMNRKQYLGLISVQEFLERNQ